LGTFFIPASGPNTEGKLKEAVMAHSVSSRTQQVSPIADLIDLVAIAFGVGCVGLAAYGILVLFG
jgi:hypothetical protein